MAIFFIFYCKNVFVYIMYRLQKIKILIKQLTLCQLGYVPPVSVGFFYHTIELGGKNLTDFS